MAGKGGRVGTQARRVYQVPRGHLRKPPSHYAGLMSPELAGRVADAFESLVRENEERWLSPLAVRSYDSRGRNLPEEECRLRTPFQRDRDRIVHSKAFRRLRLKTQVFVDPEGDHFRTRLTHTLETTGIARGVARALRLNEDLVEAIGLGHDLGHPPFGHAGEQALDELLRERGGRRLSPQRALAPRRRAARAGREGPQPDVGGAGRHPQAHRRRRSGDARGEDRAHRRPRRVHQPRHRRRDPRRSPCAGRPARARDRASRRHRLAPDRHARARPRRELCAGRRHRAERRDRRGDARAPPVHVRPRVPAAGARAPSARPCGASSRTSSTSAATTSRTRPTISPA